MSELRGRAAINKQQQLRFEALMPSLEGTLAVFRERPLITVVRVSQISSDDNGMHCLLTDAAHSGLCPLPARSPEGARIGASWDVFSGDEHNWYASYVSWDLFFERDLLEEVLAWGREEAHRGRPSIFDRGRIAVLHFRRREHERLTEVMRWPR